MAKTPKQTAWDVKLTPEKRDTFREWICTEIQNAMDARSTPIPEVQYWWTLYEQGRTRNSQTAPWQDAADMTSYLGTQNVDALRSRIMRTIFVDPVFTVEGWGESASKAPFVEDFHQWQIEAEGVQSMLGRAIQGSLVETRGVLEVFQDTTERVCRKEIRAQVAMTPDGQWQMNAETMSPELLKGPDGDYIEAEAEEQATADVVIDYLERVRKGPGYRVINYENFLVLPSHAREKSDIFGYAKRFTKRWDELQEAVKAGMYDKQAVDQIHASPDMTSEVTLAGGPVLVAPQEGPTAEKELWEIQILTNLDKKGLRWYLATVHLPTRTVLRIKYDDVNMGRFILFVPFPRTDRSHEGYSFIGHKLITVIEEHTAWRNMLADRASLLISAPIKRLVGALWDPDDQPIGPKSVIDVRDMNEVMAMDLPDLTNAAQGREQEILQASERIAGINDVAAGLTPTTSRTLGETNLVAEQSFVRMDEVIKNLQEPLEELGQIRHAIWLNTLRDAGDKGMPMPNGLAQGEERRQDALGMELRGGDVTDGPQAITADMLEGVFRFKPRGSVENADVGKQRADWMSFLQAIPMMLQIWPAMMQQIGGNPNAAKSALEQTLRLFRVSDKQAWLMPPPVPPPMIDPATGQPMPPGMPGAPPGPGGPPGMPPEIAAMMGGGAPPPGV